MVLKIARFNRWSGQPGLRLCFGAGSASDDVEAAPSATETAPEVSAADSSCSEKNEIMQNASKEPAAAPSDGAGTEGAGGTAAAAVAGGSRAARACKAAAAAWADTANGFRTLFSRRLVRTSVLLFVIW